MKRSLRAAGIVVAIMVAGAYPSAADFHPACVADTNAADARVALTAAGQALTFSGRVACPGADSVSITVRLVQPGGGTPATATASCTNCTAALTASGTLDPATAGVYAVRMSFTASDAVGGTFSGVRRDTVYVWPGTGQPVGQSCLVVINACANLP